MRTKGLKKHVLMQKIEAQKKGQRDYMSVATSVMFTQMSAKKGIKMFVERAIAAMLKEFKQLVDQAVPGKPVRTSIDPDSLDYKQKRQALEAVNLIKEKRHGTIKG
eukprot:13750629-Ditylum_brightwellii.AAC.1